MAGRGGRRGKHAGIFPWSKKNDPGSGSGTNPTDERDAGEEKADATQKVEKELKKLTVKERFVVLGDLIKKIKKSYDDLLEDYEVIELKAMVSSLEEKVKTLEEEKMV